MKITIELPESSAQEFVRAVRRMGPIARLLSGLGVSEVMTDSGETFEPIREEPGPPPRDGTSPPEVEATWEKADRFSRVTRIAIEHVVTILETSRAGEAHEVYREFINVPVGPLGVKQAPPRTIRLVREICRLMGWDVSFLRWSPGGLQGFASWLVVDFAKRNLTIVYDFAKIKNAVEGDFEQQKLLGKVLLKECGHAALHLDLLKSMTEKGEDSPALSWDHAQEAWVYASVIWGFLTGEHSRASRSNTGIDEGYLLG